LLEKTRITKQVDGERNYHVFYQLLAGAEPETLTDLGLDVSRAASHYSYLGCRGAPEMSEHDAKGFEETRQCLQSIGLSFLQQKNVFSIVAAVLHLGNIQFEENGDDDNHHEGDHAKIKEESAGSLKTACELLGIDEAKLSEALLTKSLNVNGKTIKKRQNVAMAEDKRDALAKLTYSSLFLWLVKRVNETLNQTSNVVASPKKEQADKGFIGVLDIYGFECFETNGYEQLLINYCNEKLQRHFNRHLFEVEQQIYVNEGVDWTYITFNDNRPCLELIEGGGGCVGILNTLDDAWGGMGTATEKDTKFVTHLHKLFGPVETKKDDDDANGGGHKNYTMPKFGNDRQFIIVHYAGEVRSCFRQCSH
jgi:myosin heavy subunit